MEALLPNRQCFCGMKEEREREKKKNKKKKLENAVGVCLCQWRKGAVELCERKSENLLKFPVSSSLLVLATEKLKGLRRFSGN